MLGETNTGKTCLVLRLAKGYYRDYANNATVGAFFVTKRMRVQDMPCKIHIWDTAGQEQFRKLAPMYYNSAAAAIICYDVTSPKSFETLQYWIDELHQNAQAGNIALAVCATKCDLSTEPDVAKGEELAQAIGALFMKTSAKENINVTELFENVAQRVLTLQKENDDIPVKLGTVDTPTNGTTPRNSKRFVYDDDDIVDPTASNDSSTAQEQSRCDANMLMCADNAQNCVIL